MRLRTRLTLVSAGLMAVVLAGVGTFLFLRLQADLQAAVDVGLRARAESLAGGGVLDATAGGLIEADEAFTQLLGPDGEIVGSSFGLPGPLLSPSEVTALDKPRFFDRTVRTAEEPVPARLFAVPGGATTLVVGASLEEQREAVGRLGLLLMIGGPLALFLATGVGWLVAGAALGPVERMRAEAAAISASEPGRRLARAETRDEIGRLGETLNLMLDRLEEALARERRLVDEASHELRTPLANLRAELELALRRARTPQELERALRSASEETDRLVRLAEDLLVLARADRGRLPVRREPVELLPLVDAAVEALSTRAARGGVSVERLVPGGLRASLDPLRVRQALGNLLDNALRSTPSGGRVLVEAASSDGVLSLEVRDSGEGFPESFLADAFEAFARPDGPRSRHDGGTGLGLAIVRAVAEAHGGEAVARNLPEGGASVTLRIPG